MPNTETLQDNVTDIIAAFAQPLPEAVSIIIPTFNEAENIAELLLRIHQAFTDAALSYEVIVVDDRSTDDTRAVACAVASEYDLPVQILSKQGQPGKSSSLLEGFAAAQFALLAMIDGDLQYPPEALPTMVMSTSRADIIIADRRPTYCSADRVRSWFSAVFTGVITMLFGIDTDMQSGLKVFRREIYEHGVSSCAGSWSFDLYLVTHAIFQGYTLINVPIAFQKRKAGVSKVRPIKVALELLLAALQVKMYRVATCITRPSVLRGEHSLPTRKSNTLANGFFSNAEDQEKYHALSDAVVLATSTNRQRQTLQLPSVSTSDAREESELCVVTVSRTGSEEKRNKG